MKIDMDKKFSQQLNKDVSDGGHKTHTTALVLMVLFTGLVLTIALGDTGSFNQPENTPTSSSSSDEAISPAIADIGSGQVAAAVDIFSNIPVDPDVEVSNEMVTRGGEPVEQVIRYETTRTNGDLRQDYYDWLTSHGYTIEKERIGNYAASFAATRGDSALIVLLSYLTVGDMSRVEIINYRR